METPVEPVAMRANDAPLQLILAAAYRLHIAANELLSINRIGMSREEYLDAANHAHAELGRANDEYKHAIGKQPEPEMW